MEKDKKDYIVLKRQNEDVLSFEDWNKLKDALGDAKCNDVLQDLRRIKNKQRRMD